ncbi:DNA-directed RNA polymerase specialized sigma subunit, sigma24 family [Fodinibius roseus]|uniref:DNA-directed RNA polymerase specialized sigma subunit, sigma24 family n=1 Tax=Fodinibius roseus TaxID=1194090 RepID=A0A1M5KGV8_9BACT|nr:sigma-70 family RNA polymerase sigma factor [Fodinibius roseus]SHG52076.1 DNA-directed RNA polymerase specialized sigma subunit, sigma24 family [Fodinibius roseus]
MDWKDFENETTEDLMAYVKFKEDPDYEDAAKAAFTALTFRFRSDIIDKCTIICRKWGYTDDDAIELAKRTFERFWKYPTFSKSECRVEDTDECFKLYLYRISQNELKRSYNKKDYPYGGDEKIRTSLIDEDKSYTPGELKTLQEAEDKLDNALENLTQKHKIIFLTYSAYEEEGYKLPRELLKKLRKALDLTQSSIRVYKKDAFEAIEKRIK